MATKRLPRVFIGSSVEGLPIARAVQVELDYDAECTLWNQGVFELSASTLESLVAVRDIDFALMVFTPDDITKVRDKTTPAVRDNVVFELGLFVGKLGRERTFILRPRDTDMRIPTDLLGITPAMYRANRSDGNLQAAVAAACERIRSQMAKTGLRPLGVEVEEGGDSDETDEAETLDDDDILSLLESWVGENALNDVALRYANVDRTAGVPPGSAKRFLPDAGRRWGMRVHRAGGSTITLTNRPADQPETIEPEEDEPEPEGMLDVLERFWAGVGQLNATLLRITQHTTHVGAEFAAATERMRELNETEVDDSDTNAMLARTTAAKTLVNGLSAELRGYAAAVEEETPLLVRFTKDLFDGVELGIEQGTHAVKRDELEPLVVAIRSGEMGIERYLAMIDSMPELTNEFTRAKELANKAAQSLRDAFSSAVSRGESLLQRL